METLCYYFFLLLGYLMIRKVIIGVARILKNGIHVASQNVMGRLFYFSHGRNHNSLNPYHERRVVNRNRFKEPAYEREVDIAEAIALDEFYLWLTKEGYVREENLN